jgi:hypothetical protein
MIRIRQMLRVVFFAALAMAAPAAFALTLSTNTTTDGGGEGAFFNVTTNDQAVTITGFEATLVGNVNTRVYYRAGTYLGFENNAAAWTLLGSQNIAGGSGIIQTLYPINAVGNLVIPANQTYGFLIYTGFVTTFDQAVRIDTNTAVTVNDANITVYAGHASFGGDFFTPFDGTLDPRGWRGSVIYNIGVPAPAAVPTFSQYSLVLLGLLMAGLAARRLRCQSNSA